ADLAEAPGVAAEHAPCLPHAAAGRVQARRHRLAEERRECDVDAFRLESGHPLLDAKALAGNALETVGNEREQTQRSSPIRQHGRIPSASQPCRGRIEICASPARASSWTTSPSVKRFSRGAESRSN